MEANELTLDDMIGIVSTINDKVAYYRRKIVKQLKIMIWYMLLGMFVVTISSVFFSIYINYVFSFFMVAVYFLGLYLIRRKTTKLSAQAEKEFFFNLALIVFNFNEETLVPKYKLKCTLGHLGQWVEFHSLRQSDQLKSNI